MDYLTYIQHDAENLQFYLWLRDYTRRFAEEKLQDQVLSPEWKSELSLSSTTPARASRGPIAKQGNPLLTEVEYGKLKETNPNMPDPGVFFTTISTLATSRKAEEAASSTSLTRAQEPNRM